MTDTITISRECAEYLLSVCPPFNKSHHYYELFGALSVSATRMETCPDWVTVDEEHPLPEDLKCRDWIEVNHGACYQIDETDIVPRRQCLALRFSHRLSPYRAKGAATGADRLGEMWAARNNIPLERYPADWNKDGYAAGPIRNQRMLKEGKPDLVVAFPGGRGTADMVKRAQKAGVKVLIVGE